MAHSPMSVWLMPGIGETRRGEFSPGGIDPAAMRKQDAVHERIEASPSFRHIAEKWLDKWKREGLGDVTLNKARWHVELAYPTLGDDPLREITTLELLAVLKSAEGRGRHVSAGRLRSVCGCVLHYGIAIVRTE